MTASNVVNVNVDVEDLADFPRMNAICQEHFAENPPARTTVPVKRCSPGMRVKISQVAMKGKPPRERPRRLPA